MMGWFMSKFILGGDKLIIEVIQGSEIIGKFLSVYVKGAGIFKVFDDEIDDLIAALQKAKAIMAIDKSK